ncbi:winged helix-turn-helix transcriptional regulator [Priestia sp. FSL H7-0729]
MSENIFQEIMYQIEGKGKIFILNELALHGTQRYSELKLLLPHSSDQLLTNKLKELLKYNLISRTIFLTVPPKVEYSITVKGQNLIEIVCLLDHWATHKPILYKNKYFHCEVGFFLNFISGKWKLFLLDQLTETKRFMELKSSLPEITKKMLTHQLRELEMDGIVHREVYPEIPPRVEYSLTENGKELIPLLNLLKAWGKND